MMRQGFEKIDWNSISKQSKNEFVLHVGYILKEAFSNCSNKLYISSIIYHISVIYLIKHYASYPIQTFFLPRLVSGDIINLLIDKNINKFIHKQSADLATLNRDNKANIFANKLGNKFSFILQDIEYPFDLNHPECLPNKICIISNENAKLALSELLEMNRYFFAIATDAHIAKVSLRKDGKDHQAIHKCIDLSSFEHRYGKYPTRKSENDQY